MSEDRITHAEFTLPKPDAAELGRTHPLVDKKNHARLLDYIGERLKLGKEGRDRRVQRYAQIDRDVAAFLKLDDEDRKRQILHAQTGDPQATKISLPLMFIHLDDMMTYYAQTFAPNRGMFYHTAKPDETPEATQLVSIMNNHAVHAGYYRQLLRSIFSILKYNIGGVWNSWDLDYGPKLEADESGGTRLSQQVVFAGNRIRATDMYNFMCDPAVEMQELYQSGEWVAEARMVSHFWLKSKCLEGRFVNCDSILKTREDAVSATYYKHPPVESRLEQDDSASAAFSWYDYMTGVDSFMMNGAFELVTMYIKINPNDFSLIRGNAQEKAARNRYEVWRITLLNGKEIIEVAYMNHMHGHLPCYMGVLNDDTMRDAAKSVAEILNPLQQFSSFLLNTHVLANRKNIFGTTYYDPSCIDMEKIPAGEVAARIPIKPQGAGRDIRTMVQHDDNQLDTRQTLQDLQGMMGLVDQFFPTQSMPSQIASIDRAVDSQVAAVQQGSNRRQHKGARLIDETMLRPMRFGMYYNIVQFQEDGESVADFYTGKSMTVDLTSLKDVNLSLIIGQGLKALDRQMIQSQLREIIFALIQAPQASQGIDLLGLLDHWTSMMDLDMNIKQFEIQQPPAEGAPQIDAGGNPIQPATAPAQVTGGPIYE